jgi:hypothetical protein
VVIRDAAYLSGLASFVRDTALLLPMSNSIAEQALMDAYAIACQVPVLFAPLASFVVLVGAVLPPVHKVVEASIKHGPWDV